MRYLILAFVMCSCSYETFVTNVFEYDAGDIVDSGAEYDAGAVIDSGVDTESATDTESESATDTESESATDTESESATDTESESATDTESESATDTESESAFCDPPYFCTQYEINCEMIGGTVHDELTCGGLDTYTCCEGA